MTDSQPKVVVVVFGPQGSGKGTQAARLAERFHYQMVEAGSLLRRAAETNPELKRMTSQGLLVPDEIVSRIIDNELGHDDQSGFVLDGYPRDSEQFRGFERLVNRYHWRVVAVFISLSDDSAAYRLSQRFQIIDGQKVVREDDKPAIVQKRLDTFKRQTLPLKDRFAQEYELVEINGEPPIELVTAEINQALDRLLHA